MSVLTVVGPPEPVIVEVVSNPPAWWEIVGALAPFAVLLAAILATVMTFATLRQRAAADRAALEQRRRADDRAEWWRRTQWAIDAATSLDPIRQEAGVEALLQLSYSDLAMVCRARDYVDRSRVGAGGLCRWASRGQHNDRWGSGVRLI